MSKLIFFRVFYQLFLLSIFSSFLYLLQFYSQNLHPVDASFNGHPEQFVEEKRISNFSNTFNNKVYFPVTQEKKSSKSPKEENFVSSKEEVSKEKTGLATENFSSTSANSNYIFFQSSPGVSSSPAPSPQISNASSLEAQTHHLKSGENIATLRIRSEAQNLAYNLPIVPGETTVLDLLLEAKKRYGLSIEYTGKGTSAFIEAIGGVQNSDHYWLYYVNGEFADLGAGSQKVYPGDIIEWRFE